MTKAVFSVLLLSGIETMAGGQGGGPAAPVGVFQGSADVGVTPRAGAAEFDRAGGKYRITGGGLPTCSSKARARWITGRPC